LWWMQESSTRWGTVLDEWFIVGKDAVRRFLAALLGVEEGKIELRC